MPAQPNDEERLLVSKARAAELLSISHDTFQRVVMADIRRVKIGRRVLFSVRELARWVEDHAAYPLDAELPNECRAPGRYRHAMRPRVRSTSRRRGGMVERQQKDGPARDLAPAPNP
jgi:hypothetical protein